MGKTRKRNPQVKLIVGFIYKDEAFFVESSKMLKKRFGRVDFESGPIDFKNTSYYEKEMGAGLKRRFVSFAKLVSIEELYRIKLYTNRLESRNLDSGMRRVNIDPGYIDPAKLVLASTKDYSHRIYLRKGIFAEVALTYRGGTFTPNDWTYPDYCSAEYIGIFNQIRRLRLP